MHKISISKQKTILNLIYQNWTVYAIAKKTRVSYPTAMKYCKRFSKEIENAEKELQNQISSNSTKSTGFLNQILYRIFGGKNGTTKPGH